MLSKRFTASLFAACAGAGLAAGSSPAASEPAPADVPTQYRPAQEGRYWPLQSLSYVLGSKFVSGYFTERAGYCAVTLMVTENGDPDTPPPVTPARLRLLLAGGQSAGLDSAEGRSLSFTCAADAKNLMVEGGRTEALAARFTAPTGFWAAASELPDD